MIDIPLTISFDKQAPAGRIQIEEMYSQLLERPDMWSFAVAFTERDGVKHLVEVSIVPIARVAKPEEV